MQVQDAYPIIVTDKVAECRDFYTRRLGFRVAFEASWFVYLASAGARPFGVAFMSADHPSEPPGSETFSGRGMFLTLQVEDAARECDRLREAGMPIAYPLRDEPWGQRRFGLLDPAGTWVDVVQHIDPAPGWWDRYLTPSDST
jgi:catechol 2,3-dioxygenase-like lactoylglutathione lyase family enzyme